MDVPMAPGLGLTLEKVHYDWYDGKFGKDRELLDSWEMQEVNIHTTFSHPILSFRAIPS